MLIVIKKKDFYVCSHSCVIVFYLFFELIGNEIKDLCEPRKDENICQYFEIILKNKIKNKPIRKTTCH